ncbi:MAG: hypothetical protein ACYCYF_00800, partial [Anaerolineae bacterium]
SSCAETDQQHGLAGLAVAPSEPAVSQHGAALSLWPSPAGAASQHAAAACIFSQQAAMLAATA